MNNQDELIKDLEFSRMVLIEMLKLTEGKDNLPNAYSLLDFYADDFLKKEDRAEGWESAEKLAATFLGKYRKSIKEDAMEKVQEALAQIEAQND